MVAYGKFYSSVVRRKAPKVAGLASTYSWVSEGAFCDGLEQCRFTNVGEANLTHAKVSDGKTIETRYKEVIHTMPLFRLFPGRPRRIFFSSACFLGGILFLLAKVRI